MKLVPKGPQYAGMGSDNGLMQIKWQAIIWTNDALIHSHTYASLCHKLTRCGIVMPYGDINLGQHWLR